MTRLFLLRFLRCQYRDVGITMDLRNTYLFYLRWRERQKI